MNKHFYVYILANQRNGTLYIGVTSDLIKRVFQHKEGLIDGFTKKYKVKMLVYYEQHNCAQSAIKREKQMKEWKRQWNLIEKNNPNWHDLYNKITGFRPTKQTEGLFALLMRTTLCVASPE